MLQTKYAGFQAALARKYLKNCEQIEVSEEFIRQRLLELYPREKKAESKGHPLRRRRSRFGELIQIDGSRHRWFGEDKPFVSFTPLLMMQQEPLLRRACGLQK